MSDTDSSDDSDASKGFETCSEYGIEESIQEESSEQEENGRQQDGGGKGPYNAPAVQPSAGAHIQVSGSGVGVSQQGVTFNIGRRANVNLHYGANIGQQESYPHKVSDLVQNMERSKNAEYNMTKNVSREPCTPGTRVAQLQRLDTWSKADPVMLYWLSGIAGTGKTTLSVSFCKILNEGNRLGASFFCSRSLQDSRDVRLIIPTVAHQLAMRYPIFEEALTAVLERDPDVFTRNLDGQLHKLIIDPWRSCSQNLPADMVIVLDALDECESGHRLFLNTIFENATKLPFKLLITSRPDYSIRETMKAKDPHMLSTFILHEVEKDLVEADIATYLNRLLSGRIPPDIIDELRVLSGSFFIVAATICKLFIGGNINARKRLELLKTSMNIRQKAFASIDELYLGVLYTAFYGEDLLDEEIQEIKDVLFLIVCARDPLTILGLAGILGISSIELTRRLDSLHSVLSVPTDDVRPVVIFHASFADFLLDILRSGKFFCDPDQFHLKIVNYCLEILNQDLQQSVCKPVKGTSHDLVQVGSNSTHAYASPVIRYAAVYWAAHLALSGSSLRQALFDKIADFLTIHGLHWVEYLSQLSQLPVAVQSLETIQGIADEKVVLGTITYEYLRMVQYFYGNIQDDPMAIYRLTNFFPTQSSLRKFHAGLLSNSLKVLCGVPTDWPLLERVIDLHHDYIYSIAISQNGSRMASGSEDRTIRIWNIRQHSEECVLTGHTDRVNSVVITGNGSRVVSGSIDGTIRIWDVAANKVVFTLHTSEPVQAVAISSDEMYLVSGGYSGDIQVWNAADGRLELLHRLDAHTHLIRSLSFVSNTHDFVSGSYDRTAGMWNALTGEKKSTLRGHTDCVNSVACSPSGDRIVTGSDDNTARLWNIHGQELQVLQGHTDCVRAVAFMPDGIRVVTGSLDHTLRIWDADTGHTLHVFTATDDVRPVAIFPGGLKIASSSGSQIDIWSMRSVDSQMTANEKARVTAIKAESMVLSSDGQRALLLPSLQILDTSTLDERVVLNSQNRGHVRGAWSATRRRVAISTNNGYKIEVWELNGDDGIVGNPLTLTGHISYIFHISFSHDERHLCSASDDKTVRIWDVTTGEQVHALQHPGWVYCASFSHNDTQLVSHCETTIYTWTTQTGEQLYQFNTTPTYSCAFTPDDQHIIISDTQNPGCTITTIWNARTGEKENEHQGYDHWTTLQDGTSYTLSRDGWVCQFARLGDTPRQLAWIPHEHRPNLWVCNTPLFSLSSQCVQLCLPRRDGLMTLIILQESLG